MAAISTSRRGAAIAATVAICAGLILAGCEPSPRETPPVSPPAETSSPAPSAEPSSPLPSSPSTVSAPPGQTVHFTAQGDIGVSTGAKKVLDVIAGLRPQFNLALGDFAYKAGIEQEFCDMVNGKLGQNFPYQLITGNHESDGSDGDIAKFVGCLPNRLPGLQGEYGIQWYVDVPQENPVVRFIMVSPGIDFKDGRPLDYSKDSERWRWTADAIDGAASAQIPWTVVGMHTPCLSVGKYECQAGRDFTNMLMEKKVDLVLAGHDHDYQRTHQLTVGGSCPGLQPESFSPACLKDTDQTMVKGAGTVFATVGTGGVGLYDVNDNDAEAGYFAAWSGRNRDPSLGTLDLTATADELSARFVPVEGDTFTDSFAIGRR